ncbi:WD40 repeat domain-containing serine/threonine protein kinase [Streptomyces hydrogenans]|uniref:WD40 repeat domain-containing serine/threonine protein kinase n=1 Tax=Streptomyces hydrogenans TaxID=1873719 RepID=UPI0035D6F0AB
MPGTVGDLVSGRYRLDDLVGQGGCGRVWRGFDPVLKRVVAIKEVLVPQGLAEAERSVLIERAVREAQAAAVLHHRGIVAVHDVIRSGGMPWIVMQFLEGRSLQSALGRRGRLPWREAAGIGAEVADALAHAHDRGVVHRDVKPDNIMLTEGNAVLTDFGLASLADAALRLTATGQVLGTPMFMAPEQWAGGPVGPAADAWGLGGTLYAAVEGRQPFLFLAAVLSGDPTPPQHAGPLAPLLSVLLDKTPERRPPLRQVAELLAAAGHAPPQPRPKDRPQPNEPQPDTRRRPTESRTTDAGRHPAEPRTTRPGPHPAEPRTTHPGPHPAEPRPPDTGPEPRATLLMGPADTVRTLAFSPDGRLLAAGGHDTRVQLWELDDGAQTPARVFEGHEGAVYALCFSPDGRALAAAGQDGTTRVWDVATGRATAVLNDPHGAVHAVAFAPDGATLATGGWSTFVHLWQPAGPAHLASLTGHTGAVNALAFSPDGTLLASTGWDRTTRFWDPDAREGRAVLPGHQHSGTSLSFSPTTGLLAGGGWDGTVRLWTTDPPGPDKVLSAHHDRVDAVAFVPDRAVVFSAGRAGVVDMWDVAEGTLGPTTRCDLGQIKALACSPDGHRLAVAGQAHQVELVCWV